MLSDVSRESVRVPFSVISVWFSLLITSVRFLFSMTSVRFPFSMTSSIRFLFSMTSSVRFLFSMTSSVRLSFNMWGNNFSLKNGSSNQFVYNEVWKVSELNCTFYHYFTAQSKKRKGIFIELRDVC
jgi:hypothetical protein